MKSIALSASATARMANFTCRCLDAAHGAGIGPIAGVQGTRLVKREPKDASAAIRGGKRGGSRVGASRTDVDQSSRHAVAVARSRRKEQSLGGMRRREQNNSEFTMQNAQFIILSEATNAAAACGLCLARRRTTNAVQSRICLRILLYRFFVDLPISSE